MDPIRHSTAIRELNDCRRIVIKIGTNVSLPAGVLDEAYLANVAAQIARLRTDGRQPLLVTSGAVGLGARELGIRGPLLAAPTRQACAAVGQPLLIHAWRTAFARCTIGVGQVLLTREVMNRRATYLNLRSTVETMLSLGVLPIFNDNDTVASFELEIGFGDNDRLSAFIASKIDADLLLMLSDIDAIYDADPRHNRSATPLRTIEKIDERLVLAAGKRGSIHSTGGMASKLQAARIAGRAGCIVIIADGRAPDVLARLLAGEEIGTAVMPRQHLRNRERWIVNSAPRGTLIVDGGALRAIEQRNSLLPTGVKAVEGAFAAGAVVDIRLSDRAKPVARVVSGLASSDLQRVIGRHSSQVEQLLGPNKKEIIARPEDIVLLDND